MPMKRLLTILCIPALLLLGAAEVSASADFQKGEEAHKAGDYPAALRELSPLAEQGNAEAQFMLGEMYGLGQGVAPDEPQAMAWYRKAAEQGNARAQIEVGHGYRYGHGVPKDYSQAMAWYRKAAEQGNVRAQYNLGFMYYLGLPGPPDYVQTYMWYNLAAAQGYKHAAETRRILEKVMTPDQVAKAQKLTREWVEKHPHQAHNP